MINSALSLIIVGVLFGCEPPCSGSIDDCLDQASVSGVRMKSARGLDTGESFNTLTVDRPPQPSRTQRMLSPMSESMSEGPAGAGGPTVFFPDPGSEPVVTDVTVLRQLQEYSARLDELAARLRHAGEANEGPRRGQCPPHTITLTGGVEIQFWEKTVVDELFIDRADRLYSVQTAKFTDEGAMIDIGVQNAFSLVYGTAGGIAVPVFHPIDLTPMCEAATIITEPLSTVATMRHVWGGPKLAWAWLSALAVRGLELIQALHSLGLVHGEISLLAFRTEFVENPAESLRLTGFTRTSPYIDFATGEHIAQVTDPVGGIDNFHSRSPFELKGSALSRRDDIYLFADLLFAAADMAVTSEGGTAEEVADHKLAWGVHTRDMESPTALLHEFRDYALEMTFEQKPDYSKWIKVLADLRTFDNLH